MAREPKRLGTGATVVISLIILALIAATGFVVWLCIDLVNQEPELPTTQEPAVTMPVATTEATEETEPPTTAPPVPEHVVSTATFSAQGDLLMHKPVFDTCRKNDGTYDFESIFRYLKDTVSTFDYAAVNLETTFGGDDYIYQGNPHFNCPDPLMDSVVDAGFDMLLTANNHCGDTTAAGIKRTLEVIDAAGIDALGTMPNAEAPKYSIIEVNGIKVGMTCFTYATGVTDDGRPALNGNAHLKEAGLVNYFMESNLPKFYAEVEQQLADMEAEGAEATMLYIHWGTEYEIEAGDTQKKMAQKLCDLGIDVILGSHPHVVQPVELLENDQGHKTVCIYSMGNAVSNQRVAQMDLKTGHTEDGVIFTVTFEKYSDGEVYLLGVDAIPTWVNLRPVSDTRKEFNILPLKYDSVDQWQSLYQLTDSTLESAKKSYERTMDIIGDGLTECKSHFGTAKTAREEAYYTLANTPA